jgi:hypothetical protein
MFEIYFDIRGEVALEKMARVSFPKYEDRAVASALKSEGYRMRGILKEDIRAGGHGGSWDKLNPHTGVLSRRKRSGRIMSIKNYRMVWKGSRGQKKRVRKYKGVMLSTRQNPLTKLRGAIRYVYDDDLQMVSIGFVNVSRRLLALVRMHAEGFETRVTPKMRKMLFALGFPIKESTRVLIAPKRPLIEPAFEREEYNITKNVRNKILKNIMRYMNE